jgi:hypothetical protein
MKYIFSGKVVIIPDLHNALNWADSIIAKEQADYHVFLGDYFDCRNAIDNINYFGEKAVCEWGFYKMGNYKEGS